MKSVVFLHYFLGFILLVSHLNSVSSWKKEEFRNCNQTPFCKRARSRKPQHCKLIATDVIIGDGDLTAKLITPKEFQENPDEDSSGIASNPLILSLSVYENGILRMKIDEDASRNPPKKRFEVPDVILPEFESKKLWLQRYTKQVIDGDSADSFVVYLFDGYEAVLRSDPLEVFVREQSSGKRVLSFNSHGLFDFEQLRVKKEGDDWEERFRSHTDSRPYGPQSISFDMSFYGADFVYGIPEHATSLSLKPTKGPGIEESEPYRLFNLDVFEYLHESPFGLYGSIPFMLSHGRTRGTSGFFWLNAAEMQIDVLGSGWDAESSIMLPSDQNRIDTLWMSEAGIVDTFFFIGPKPKDVVKQYASVTGTSAMPQLFATGYHQCRWNYRDEEDVKNVDSKFDEYDIPYDVLWLDIEHTDGKRYFTWDKALFPNPEEMQKDLASRGRRMVTIVDPHIKRDENYHIHKEASKNGYYVKDASGKDYDGWCWPGSSSYIDMVNPDIRSWWADKFAYTQYVGSTPSLYIWNDMNEPSVFNGPERYGTVWTGDNTATWEQLRVSVPMILTLGLTGITFSGADVGGFFGNPDSELLVRWYQVAAYMPFFRGHAHHDTKRREPWLFGEHNTKLMRDAIRVRYTLLPYFYTLFREANVSGVPVTRPMWMEFPDDEATFNNDEAFMVGNGLLVQGVYTEHAKDVTVYLPKDHTWYDLRSGTAYKGGKTQKIEAADAIPVFQRSGTIIPRKDRFRRSTVQMENDPYTLVIAVDSSGEAEGELYIDDGKSYEFNKGAYIHRRFVFSNGTLTSVNLAAGTQFLSDCTIERIILLGHLSKPKSARIEPSNHAAEVELGPLQIQSKIRSSVLTIRKPNVRVSDDWTIKLL
ncbi:Galactose mutarotase-like domain-containing protein [Cynara cardunculus var. scolymus]|uniref:Glucosidase II subunit alpha n=1 Tax=Cynara cardunculus var. scolymus TaxID=59895 RepID=A0A118JRW7_CYNCS|nr:Galactose mutarotase-like domain-containing protein [Cynara cardunculus var. scolymus]